MAAVAGRALLRGTVRGLLLPRLARGTPGPERDFSLSHNRVRASSELWGSSPQVGLFTPEYCSGGPRPGCGGLSVCRRLRAAGGSPGDSLTLAPRLPGHGHRGALVEGAAGRRGPEAAPTPATPGLQAGRGHETRAQRQPGAHPHAVGGR